MSDVLAIENLSVSFQTDDGKIKAVEQLDLNVKKGETLGLVGESGCGKSVSAMSVLRLIPRPPGIVESGRILFDGMDTLTCSVEQLRRIRGRRISMIFQEPMTALSPLHPVGDQLVETLQMHIRLPHKTMKEMAKQWLGRVGIPEPEEKMKALPHQLSGGMRQRVMIAMALLLEPELVIADEPTTALDVTIQAQVLDLMRDMIGRKTSLLLITHDMGVIWEMCSRVAVMYASELVEESSRDECFMKPLHPYTEALLESVPGNAGWGKPLQAIEGNVPSSLEYPQGCRFADRCPYAFDRCFKEHPDMVEINGRKARCFLARQRACLDKGCAPQGKNQTKKSKIDEKK